MNFNTAAEIACQCFAAQGSEPTIGVLLQYFGKLGTHYVRILRSAFLILNLEPWPPVVGLGVENNGNRTGGQAKTPSTQAVPNKTNTREDPKISWSNMDGWSNGWIQIMPLNVLLD